MYTHILDVEDDRESREMMALMVELSGLITDCVATIERARRLPADGQFDLLSLDDLWLCDGDGTNWAGNCAAGFPKPRS